MSTWSAELPDRKSESDPASAEPRKTGRWLCCHAGMAKKTESRQKCQVGPVLIWLNRKDLFAILGVHIMIPSRSKIKKAGGTAIADAISPRGTHAPSIENFVSCGTLCQGWARSVPTTPCPRVAV